LVSSHLMTTKKKKTTKRRAKRAVTGRNCPKCKILLSRVNIFGMTLDQCPTCHGFWFDRTELNTFKDRMDDDIRWKKIDLEPTASKARFRALRPCAKGAAPRCRNSGSTEPRCALISARVAGVSG
jgi:Zn-finger nucleic acid-binding protein